MPNDVIYDIGLRIDPKKAKSGSKEVEGALNRINDRAKRLRNTVGTIFAGFSAVAAVRSLVTIGDEMTLLRARLGLVTDGYQDMISTQRELLDLSIKTNSDLSTTTDLYIKLSRALQESGESSESILGVTKTINEAFRVSGASTIERTNAIRQLNQAMASGVLRGDEFRAVSEQGIRVTQLLADSLNVTIGELREMAHAGELTTDVLIRAFKDQSQVVAEESAKIPRTVGEAFTNLSSVYKTYIGDIDKANGITKNFASIVQSFADNLPQILDVVKTLGVVLLASFGGRLLTAIGSFTLRVKAGTTALGLMKKSASGLMSILGGLPGVLILGTTQISSYINNLIGAKGGTKEWKEETEKLISVMKDLNIENQNLAIASLTNNINAYAEALDKAKSTSEFFGVDLSKGAIEILQGKLDGTKQRLADLIVSFSKTNNVIKTTVEETKKLTQSQIDDQNTIKSWLKEAKKKEQSLFASNKLLQLGEKGYLKYQGAQLKAIATTEAERKEVDELIESQIALIDMRDDIKSGLDEVTSAQEIYNSLLEKQRESLPEIIKLEKVRETQLNALDLLREKGIINEMEYGVAVDVVIGKFQDEEKAIRGVNNEAKKSKGIFATFFAELKKGFKNAATSIFGGLTGGANISGLFSGNANGFVNGLQGFSDGLSNIASVFEQSGGNILRSANTLLGGAASSVLAANAAGVGGLSGLASIAGPVAIAAIVAGLIDNISGGKLFGTSFEQVGSGFTGGITGAGSVGSQSITEQKERSFFRGTATRVTTSELDQELRRIFDEIFDTSILVAEQTARTLGIDIATLVTGSITQAFDENGELTSSISTVLGRTYEEGIEEFAQRLTAENILAQLAQNATSVSVTRTTSASTINNPLFDSEFSDIGEIVSTTTSMVNEVHAIAEQWRNDSALLLEGAQFLLLAQTDLNNGFDLLNDGTLTQITDLIQGFNRAGETLSETYSRVVLSTNNFENALDLMGISIDKKRQQFIQFAVDITDAAGGLDQASSLWNSYIKDFFSSNEVLTNSLDALNQDINAQLSELGVKVDFDSFRQRFEEALPTLSPQEVVQWLRLGQALGDANNLAGELAKGGIVEAITNYAGLSQEVANASQTLDQSLISNFNSINDLINAYDGSIESERSIAAGLNARYNMELQFIEQIRTASESVRQTIASSIDSIRASQMTDEERYDFLTSQAEALASSLSNLTDPEEIERVINEITRLQNEAFGLLDESGQAQRADDFILFLEEVGKISQGRLRQLETDISKDSDNLVKQMEELLIASQEREDEAIRRFDNSVSRITKATDIFDSATQRFAGSNIQVDVNNPVYDVDNL